jgi:hypothetical protein
MFKNTAKNLRAFSYKIGKAGGAGYSTIRKFEKKATEIDKGFGGVLGDLFRASPASLLYNQTVVPAKKALQITEKVFTGIGESKRRPVAEGLIDLAMLSSGGTNDFIERSLNSNTFNTLFKSPYVQNYLNS